jgi:hypothetical protein
LGKLSDVLCVLVYLFLKINVADKINYVKKYLASISRIELRPYIGQQHIIFIGRGRGAGVTGGEGVGGGGREIEVKL